MIPYNTGRPSKIGNHSLDPFGSFPFVCNCRGSYNKRENKDEDSYDLGEINGTGSYNKRENKVLRRGKD
jgi:hypothetical protein